MKSYFFVSDEDKTEGDEEEGEEEEGDKGPADFIRTFEAVERETTEAQRALFAGDLIVKDGNKEDWNGNIILFDEDDDSNPPAGS